MAEFGALILRVLPLLIIIGIQIAVDKRKRERRQRTNKRSQKPVNYERPRQVQDSRKGSYLKRNQDENREDKRGNIFSTFISTLEAEIEREMMGGEQRTKKMVKTERPQQDSFRRRAPIEDSSMAPQILEPQELEAEESLPYDKVDELDKSKSQGKGIFDGQRGSVSMNWEKMAAENRETFSKRSGAVADLWVKQDEQNKEKSILVADSFYQQDKLRQAIIMKEILEPPVSLRK